MTEHANLERTDEEGVVINEAALTDEEWQKAHVICRAMDLRIIVVPAGTEMHIMQSNMEVEAGKPQLMTVEGSTIADLTVDMVIVKAQQVILSPHAVRCLIRDEYDKSKEIVDARDADSDA